MQRASVGVLMAAVAIASPACMRQVDTSDPASCVPGAFAADAGEPGSGPFMLVVGTQDAVGTRVATAWHDGDHVALVRGGQGGFMIRPSIDVTAPAPLVESDGTVCLGVRMTAAPPAEIDTTLGGVQATRVAGTNATYHVAALFGLLASSLSIDGASVIVGFDVQQAGGGDGHARLTVVPDSTVAQ